MQGRAGCDRDDQRLVSDSARSPVKGFSSAKKMRAADTQSYLYIREASQKERVPATSNQLGHTGVGCSGSIPVLLMHALTKHRQRDGGEKLGQPWGEPKPHAQQPHQVGHSPRSSLHEEKTLENTASSSTVQGICWPAPSHHVDHNSNVTLPRSIPQPST